MAGMGEEERINEGFGESLNNPYKILLTCFTAIRVVGWFFISVKISH